MLGEFFVKYFIMDGCETKKKQYLTESAAEDALIGAWSTYGYKDNQGPVGFYLCDSCGYYHLTSKGDMNPKLAEQIASGKIRKQEEANRWIEKLKRKH